MHKNAYAVTFIHKEPPGTIDSSSSTGYHLFWSHRSHHPRRCSSRCLSYRPPPLSHHPMSRTLTLSPPHTPPRPEVLPLLSSPRPPPGFIPKIASFFFLAEKKDRRRLRSTCLH